MVSRTEAFDEIVRDAAARLETALGGRYRGVEFAVEDVPPSDPAPWEDPVVPLGRVFPEEGSLPTRIVIYRRPVEARVEDERELPLLVHEVLVEQVAALLGVPPADIDPRAGD